ncbi:MAG: FAD-binding and (Fe-S)-binding domain-containing protein [Paracoccaceae bacterium]
MATTSERWDMDWDRLAGEIEGEVLSGAFDRGRYATDASIYQIIPAGVIVPRTFRDVETTLSRARDAGMPVTARGGGTSQAGQTINKGVVLDFSRYLNEIIELDIPGMRAVVQPGIVLDELNKVLKPHGLWFPVDVSTASRATIGGMAANNSCGSRSIKYGLMRDNVIAIDGLMADGSRARFEDTRRAANNPLITDLMALGAREAEEIAARFPQVGRRVGGYNIDALVPGDNPIRLSDVLVGSEGTLAISETVEIRLSPLLNNKALGVCHFSTFHAAMDAAQHIVELGPVAVELVDHNMIQLGRDIPQFRPVVEEFVDGDPAALLLVEFAEPDPAENLRRLDGLADLMGQLGGSLVRAEDPAFQARIWGVRTQGLNIMMSMREAGKPVSFVEDCAVALPDLAEFTDRLTGVFRKHGTDGTWYAHASVGLLHVRPVLNLKEELGAKQLRAIAEESFDVVADYKGSHSGEHGDGIVRSEFHEKMFGKRLVGAFEELKDRFDPKGALNPGKIVRAPQMDDRSLFRYPPDYTYDSTKPKFDWSGWPGGLHGAVEMCNNNGACRKLSGGAMCPSYRATRNERDLTRGRANTLRLALTGQLGPDAFASDEMAETMKLCVGCKACKRECPMSVDMAKMKIEAAAARADRQGVALRERLVAHLPRYAPFVSLLPYVANLRDQVPGFAWLSEKLAGLSAQRTLPKWHFAWREPADQSRLPDVIFLADTFNRYFEPENCRAAVHVLEAAGLVVGYAQAPEPRPLCCGRTYLSAGMVDHARAEMERSVNALRPWLEAGLPIVGLEPSCVLTFRDEAPRLLPNWTEEDGRKVMLFEEYVATLDLPTKRLNRKAWLHGHCHQKAEAVMGPVEATLRRIEGLDVNIIDSSCCGMAGAFGYQAETIDVSKAMGELSLLPTVRGAGPEDLIVADGTSCRHQIEDGAGRDALHVARVLEMALDAR